MGSEISKVKIPSKLNLIESAQAEYDFLRLIDQHPVLYSENVLRNAVYRYENYWLPLALKHNEVLPAPLDIEWVWHCHILNPIAYQHDCLKLVGQIINHAPMYLTAEKISTSKMYWTKTYKGIPFEVDLTNPSPPIISTEPFKCSYDIVAASSRQRVFNYNSSLVHFRDIKFLKNAVKRYLTMLIIKRDNPDIFIVPCYDNDLIWHSHQQHVLLYQSDMKSIIGNILDHNDSVSDRSPDSELTKNSAVTKELWKKYKRNFSVSGAMYRGEPPFPSLSTFKPEYYSNLANRIYQCSPSSIYIGPFPVTENATITFYIRMVSLQGASVGVFSKTVNLISGELHYNFLEAEGHFQYSTEQSGSLEICCEYHDKSRKYTGCVGYSQFSKSVDPNFCSITVQLGCSLTGEMISSTLTMRFTESLSNYSFLASSANRDFVDSPHLRNVLHNLLLISPKSEYKSETRCQYHDNVLHTTFGTLAFKLRVVHSLNPRLSAIEIIDFLGNVVATSHTVGSFSLPSVKQVSKLQNVFTHDSSFERSMLIRGSKGDWGLLKSSWKGFAKAAGRKRGQRGELKLKLFTLNGKISRYEYIARQNDVKFEWATIQGRGSVDLLSGCIQLSGSVVDVAEFVCVGCSIAVLFVLCQPRPPPPKTGGVYPPPPSNRPGVLNLDAMSLLVSGGLYAATLPKWYHINTQGGYFIQTPPKISKHCIHDGGDDFEGGGDDFEGGGDNFEGGGDNDGGADFEGDCFDNNDTSWGENTGCGGCGGGDGGGGCGGGDSGGGCGGGGDSGGGCGGGDSGGGGCGGGGCGGGCGSSGGD